MLYTEEHDDIKQIVRDFVDNEINPFADEWEEAKIFPAHELFKKMGDLGLLGLNREEEDGGLGLDYSFNIALKKRVSYTP